MSEVKDRNEVVENNELREMDPVVATHKSDWHDKLGTIIGVALVVIALVGGVAFWGTPIVALNKEAEAKQSEAIDKAVNQQYSVYVNGIKTDVELIDTETIYQYYCVDEINDEEQRIILKSK